jgi:hypothetical protein
MPGSRGLLANLGWGALWGLLFGLVYVLVLGILFVLQGPVLFHAYNSTFAEVAALYLIGGVGGGLIVGLLRPLLRWRWGAALVGIFAAIPAGAGFQLMRIGSAPWGAKDTLVVMIFSVALGATVGWGELGNVPEEQIDRYLGQEPRGRLGCDGRPFAR